MGSRALGFESAEGPGTCVSRYFGPKVSIKEGRPQIHSTWEGTCRVFDSLVKAAYLEQPMYLLKRAFTFFQCLGCSRQVVLSLGGRKCFTTSQDKRGCLSFLFFFFFFFFFGGWSAGFVLATQPLIVVL